MENYPPVLSQFEVQAKMLDFAEDSSNLEDAIAMLAGWIEMAEPRLQQHDIAALICIGGTLYRESRRRRLT
ncbi:hypothetical protein GCM10027202_17990 [Microvirgula curvata]|uniref:Uncharacterized protein n=1 Tax=Microvirgula aerodenitrificans TaxID=57480 RepID=A0A2S0PED4_9NEIS|nr:MULTISPECIES: hypothetical protein [Microvirgula]AVY95736.1 hypothetical protein DAI18_18065 [Microvirgula aerodenitrificans]RAS14806.1 hypothetical protein DFO50_10961 [Microvirgula sp. AG722]